jgi:para-aminobenzoate synthetase/4-amino-4-deoxychorismate lyase
MPLKARFLTGLPNEFDPVRDHARDARGRLPPPGAPPGAPARIGAYFGYPFDEELRAPACRRLRRNWRPGMPHRLRLALQASGELAIQPALPWRRCGTGAPAAVREPTAPNDLFLRHKTSVRSRYDAAWRAAEAQGAFDTLFFNERGELTEGRAQQCVRALDGRWCTPPLSCGVLPGVMRRCCWTIRPGTRSRCRSRARRWNGRRRSWCAMRCAGYCGRWCD